MTQTEPAAPEQWNVIHAYTRAQALADAVLVVADAAMAIEAGWKYPVAYTAAAYAATIAWSEETDQAKGVETCQDQAGREWDVLYMAMNAARRAGPGQDRLPFELHVVPPTGRATRPARTTLVVHIGPGDTPEPVMTIMLPNED